LERPRLPELVAHRGFAARYPENTLPALEAAVSAGARFVEVDVQLSSDGEPVLFHDRTLERMCGVKGRVHESTLAELGGLRCAERGRFGEQFAAVRIARLADLVALLRAHAEVFAFVEIKRAAIEQFGAERVLEIVAPLLEPVHARTALISFSLPFLALARAESSFALGAVFDTWKESEAPEARALAAEYVFCDVDGLPESGSLLLGKTKLAVYEVADPARALALAGRGVDLVETFAIGEMLAALRGLEGRVG
jgi:glycerophosphoryl diester phosphodiesterase